MTRLAALAQQLRDERGTALHITADAPIRMRIEGRLVRMEAATISAAEMKDEIRSLLDDAMWNRVESGQPADFPCELGGERYRARCFMCQGGPTVILRTTANLSCFDELGLPSTVRRLAHLRRGLVLISGPSGSGKSTTVGALFSAIEEGRAKHVTTIECPIETTYAHQRTSISQREVGTHVESFSLGMRAALRQGADVIFASDIPDVTTMALVLEAAAAGTLVVATVRASGVVRAIERLVDHPDRRGAMLNGLAEHLSAVVSLLRLQKADGLGHCVAAELVVRSRGVVAALREDDLPRITNVMQKSESMQTMDDALVDLLERHLIAFEDAYDQARDKPRFQALRPRSRRSMRSTRHHEP